MDGVEEVEQFELPLRGVAKASGEDGHDVQPAVFVDDVQVMDHLDGTKDARRGWQVGLERLDRWNKPR